jgi:sterol desaturase/sphingolipid hydroxylase (fatty acid hydroxylase superfamily)
MSTFEIILRLSLFFAILLIMGLWEYLRPRRPLHHEKALRWPRNFVLGVIERVVLKVILPFTIASVALFTQDEKIGLFNQFHAPSPIVFILSFVMFDLILYAQHVAFHKIPLFWRFHKVHHIDQDVDVTTGFRVHPLQAFITLFITCAAVLIFGMPFIAVAAYEITVEAVLMCNHANIYYPQSLDRWLRLFIVTPDVHRVHHSAIYTETDSNYGFIFPWWDRLFKTYIAQPSMGHIDMEVGLKAYQDEHKTDLLTTLLLPFRHKK